MATDSTALAPFPIAWHSVSFATYTMSAGVIFALTGLVCLSSLIVFNVRLFIEPRVEGMATRDQMLPAVFFGIAFALVLAGAMAWLVGLCLCCLAPESGARPMAAAATVCCILCLLIALQVPVAPLVGIRIRPPRLEEQAHHIGEINRVTFVNDIGFGLAGVTLGIACASFTMACVCAIAHSFKNEKLARSARRLAAYQAMALPGCALIGFAHSAVADAWRTQPWYWVDLAFGLAVPIVIGVACVWMLRVLSRLRFVLRIAEENAQPFATASRAP
jgi:hypothetical protein